jgi:SAM-dependent methyltransferase
MAINEFEKEYYESDSFWSGEMVRDEGNTKRIELTGEFVLPDVNNLIDIGCGNGVFLEYMKSKNPALKLVGVERSKVALSYVTTDKIFGSIDDIPVGDGDFDCVTCLQVLEHLTCDIYEKSLDELARVSAKYIIISVPYQEVIEDNYNKCPQCKTIFNHDLHVRNYDDADLKNLFTSRGFECVRTVTTGTTVRYKGHRKFLKTFYPENFLNWNSPICPLCGFKSGGRHPGGEVRNIQSVKIRRPRKLISYFTYLPKLVWPKESKDYWIIALYKRKENKN